MKNYNNQITLTKNKRGVYCLDPISGCYYGIKNNKNGCYGDCYANRIAKRYGFDFGRSIKRYFISYSHLNKIKKDIKNIEMPFVRMGVMCDPSEDWSHTINMCELIYDTNQCEIFNINKKPIVIITKHWNCLTRKELDKISSMNICINTSISAIDDKKQFEKRLFEYFRLKKYCKSILRLIVFSFNLKNDVAVKLNDKQNWLIDNFNILKTVFMPSKDNLLVKNKIIIVDRQKFLNSNIYVSGFDGKIYFGYCNKCPEMCGINMK